MKKLSDKKKLIVILSRVPVKLDKGDKLRAFNQLKILSDHFDVYLICLDTEAQWYELDDLLKYCVQVKLFRVGKISRIWNLFKAIFSGKPYQVAYFYNSKVQRQVNEIVKNFQPDHIYAQLIRTSEYVKNFHSIPKTIDYMDAFSKGIERRIEDAGFLMKPLLKSEHKRLLKYESLIFEYFENKTIISEIDRDFIFHVDRGSIDVISNGIDPSFYDDSDKCQNKAQVLFTGNMAYPPNTKAAEFIGNELSPLMEDFKFTICGANPESLRRVSNTKNVDITGWVDDIKEVYRNSKIFIAPMFIGTGVQNKLLEAMAMGLPCITTDLANKPLKAKVGEEILIANSKEEFQDQIKKLHNDKELYHRIAANGQSFVKKNFSWKESTSKLVDIMSK